MKSNSAFIVLFVFIMTVASGCSHIGISNNEHRVSPELERSPDLNQMVTSYFWRIWTINKDLPTNETCKGSGFEQIYIRVSQKQAVFSIATLGIYSPYTVTVFCKK